MVSFTVPSAERIRFDGLEQIQWSFSVAAVLEVVLAFGGGELGDECSDASPESFDRASFKLASQRLQHREQQLDRIEIGAVGWQKQQSRLTRLHLSGAFKSHQSSREGA